MENPQTLDSESTDTTDDPSPTQRLQKARRIEPRGAMHEKTGQH